MKVFIHHAPYAFAYTHYCTSSFVSVYHYVREYNDRMTVSIFAEKLLAFLNKTSAEQEDALLRQENVSKSPHRILLVADRIGHHHPARSLSHRGVWYPAAHSSNCYVLTKRLA